MLGQMILSATTLDTELANEILMIVGSYKVAEVNEVFISSILVKKNPRLNAIIRRMRLT